MLGLEGGNRKVGKSYNYTFILYETRERERLGEWFWWWGERWEKRK
jgi:hypothetical protein